MGSIRLYHFFVNQNLNILVIFCNFLDIAGSESKCVANILYQVSVEGNHYFEIDCTHKWLSDLNIGGQDGQVHILRQGV